MRLPFVSRRRYDRDLAALDARLVQTLVKLDGAIVGRKYMACERDDLERQLAQARARADRLSEQLTAAAERVHDAGQVSRLQRRLKALQARYDEAVGLGPGGVKDSRVWQPGYAEPKPDRAPEVAS